MFKKSFFAVVLVLGLLLMASVAVASASGPLILTGSGSRTEMLDWCEGMDLQFTSSGTYTDKLFFDENGELVRLISRTSGEDVLTNMGTGKTLSGTFALTWHYRFEGDTTYWHFTGQNWNITVPGLGQVFKENGTSSGTINPFEIQHFAASHSDRYSRNFAELCAALGE